VTPRSADGEAVGQTIDVEDLGGGYLPSLEDLAVTQALMAAVVDEHIFSTDEDVAPFHLVQR
jgi:hypothetical protein